MLLDIVYISRERVCPLSFDVIIFDPREFMLRELLGFVSCYVQINLPISNISTVVPFLNSGASFYIQTNIIVQI